MLASFCLAAAGIAGASALIPLRGTSPSPVPPPGSDSGLQASVPMFKKHQGSAAISRLGENNPLQPPFCEDFSNLRHGMEHDDFERYFQVIDANGDNRGWGLYNYDKAEPYGRCAYMLFPLDKPQADDWLLTRAVRLKAGKYYCVSLDAALYLDDSGKTPQAFEVKCGLYNDVDGMEYPVVGRTEISSKTFTYVDGWFKPEFDGLYYIGIHGISPKYDNYYNYLFVDNISVAAAKEGSEPGKVGNLTFTNDPDGTTAVDIAFTAPDKTIDGSVLGSVSKIVIARNGQTVKTLTGVTPGEPCSFRDVPEAEGLVEYSVTAWNGAGEGALSRVSHFAGIAAPMTPAVETAAETAEGTVSLKWTVPETDVNGNRINADKIRYTVYKAEEEEAVALLTDLESTSAEVSFNTGRNQDLVTLLVTASLNGKESGYAATDQIAVGTPYALPHKNSFTLDDYYDYVLGMENKQNVGWRFLDDHSDPKAQDGDNGYVCMIGNEPGQTCELSTGKLDFRQSSRPRLTFYTYVYADDENEINIYGTDCATGERKLIENVCLYDSGRQGWTKVTVPLDELAGKVGRLGIEGVIVSHGYIPVDNLTVAQIPDTDLSVEEVQAPSHARMGEVFGIEVRVLNNGASAVDGYTARLERDGETVGTVEGGRVAPGDEDFVAFSHAFRPDCRPSYDFRVVIEAENEGTPEDNVSAEFAIASLIEVVPAVSDLQGEEKDGRVTLRWTAPDLGSAAPEETLEDFESYEAFATSIGDWVMHDVDQGAVGGLNDIYMPVNDTKQAYWVMSDMTPYDFFSAASGHNVLAQMYGYDPDTRRAVDCDDWLVSPELYGGTQTIGFKAASVNNLYGKETFEVYYSEGGTDPEDFILLKDETEVPDSWTQYYVNLPEGAARFAIRCTSANVYMLLIDDVSFIGTGEPRSLSLIGYNVYLNGRRLNDTPITQTSYEAPRELLTDSYYATAVYDRGESRASNVVKAGEDGVAAVGGESEGPAEYFTLQGIRVERPSEAGVYLMRRNGRTVKVFVK